MMKGSASPKPASGPVRGLTSPILTARDCAFAGMTRRTAGAATAAMPALTSVRRDGRDANSVMLTSLIAWRIVLPTTGIHFAGTCAGSGVVLARLLQMLQHFRTQRGLLLGR